MYIIYYFISRVIMTLNSSVNIVSVLKQKMIDNKSQVEKYKEEMAEKENYFQVCIQFTCMISASPPYQCVNSRWKLNGKKLQIPRPAS